MPAAPIALDIVAVRETTASGLYGLHDVLGSVGIVWETFVSGRPSAGRFRVRIVSDSTVPFRCATGGVVAPDATFDDGPRADVVVVPGISASPSASLARDDRRVFDWLRDAHAQGAMVASSCTGALVLAEAGLLDGTEATSHWAFRDVFRVHYPRVRLRLESNLCRAANGVVTAGGTSAWHQLAMYLIARYCGTEHAVQAAKFWLIPDGGELQAPYSAMPHGTPQADSAIRVCLAWIREHYAAQNPVDAMIAQSRLAATTFARRFRRTTGYAPMEYVHVLRVEQAKRMLETSGRSIEDVGSGVGYEDTASFRRLFKRQTGLTPREYRNLFGNVRFARYVNGAHGLVKELPHA